MEKILIDVFTSPARMNFSVGRFFLDLSLSLGVFIVAVSSHLKHRSLFSFVLSMAVVLCVVFVSAKTRSMDMKQMTDAGETMAVAVNSFYPPVFLVTNQQPLPPFL